MKIYVSFAHLVLIVVACIMVTSWPIRAVMIVLWLAGLWQTEEKS